LRQPVENARAIAGVLEKRFGFDTEVVANPTLLEIQVKLMEYQNKYANNTFAASGQLFIFFSGHGVKEYGAGYFLPADADPDLVISTGLPYNTWRGFVDNINCQHILVAVDACFSVTFDPDWGSMGDDDSRFRRKNELTENERELANHAEFPARLFYTSDAQEDVTPGRSNFARKLLEGLNKPRGTTDYLTAEELFASYVKRAQPTPNAGDFGRDDVRSNFLFFYKQNKINIGDAHADYAAWQIAQQTNTPAAYRQYLRDYPNGDFSFTAQEQITNLEKEERELLAWQQAKMTNTSQAYAGFIATYPDSRYAAEAQRRQALIPSLEKESQTGSTSTAPDNFIRIEGGTFTMGCQDGRDTDCDDDEKPPHQVTVSTFYLSKYEVTQAQWRQVMGSDPAELYNKGCDQCPVERVSWNDIQEFLQKLNAQTSMNYRLPTEAEWEYAARGGNQSRGYVYSGSNDVAEVAWYSANAREGNSYGAQKTTRPVGGKKPNELGLYDMSGNVWEWCSDWYGAYENSAQQNPSGPQEGSPRVLRGGSWRSGPAVVRCADRDFYSPGYRVSFLGFRLSRAGR
jgi:formylglycine-generating enzyme required for sulfatase activity